jgi:hypothetical protein
MCAPTPGTAWLFEPVVSTEFTLPVWPGADAAGAAIVTPATLRSPWHPVQPDVDRVTRPSTCVAAATALTVYPVWQLAQVVFCGCGCTGCGAATDCPWQPLHASFAGVPVPQLIVLFSVPPGNCPWQYVLLQFRFAVLYAFGEAAAAVARLPNATGLAGVVCGALGHTSPLWQFTHRNAFDSAGAVAPWFTCARCAPTWFPLAPPTESTGGAALTRFCPFPSRSVADATGVRVPAVSPWQLLQFIGLTSNTPLMWFVRLTDVFVYPAWHVPHVLVPCGWLSGGSVALAPVPAP